MTREWCVGAPAASAGIAAIVSILTIAAIVSMASAIGRRAAGGTCGYRVSRARFALGRVARGVADVGTRWGRLPVLRIRCVVVRFLGVLCRGVRLCGLHFALRFRRSMRRSARAHSRRMHCHGGGGEKDGGQRVFRGRRLRRKPCGYVRAGVLRREPGCNRAGGAIGDSRRRCERAGDTRLDPLGDAFGRTDGVDAILLNEDGCADDVEVRDETRRCLP